MQKPSKNFFGLTLWRAGKPLLLWWRCGAQHDKGIRNRFVCQSQWRTQKISMGCQSIGIARGGPKRPCPPKVLENRVILCFERRFSKQNSVIRLKLNILLYTAEFWQYTLLNTVYTFFYFFEGLRGDHDTLAPPPYTSCQSVRSSSVMESRDSVSRHVSRHVSRPAFSSLGLEGLRSRLGLEGFRSWSRALSLETLHELFFSEVLQEAAP